MMNCGVFFLVFSTCLFSANAKAKTKYDGHHLSCGRDDYMKVNEISLSPWPVTMPGDVKITASVTMLQPFNGTIHAQLTIRKNVFGGLVPVERAFDLFNVCGHMARQCFRLKPLNLPCKCPVQNGTYGVTNHHVIIPKPNIIKAIGVFENVLYGAWDATVRFIDGDTKEEIFCYKIPDLKIKKKPEPKKADAGILDKIFSFKFFG